MNEYPIEKRVHERFGEPVRRYPDAGGAALVDTARVQQTTRGGGRRHGGGRCAVGDAKPALGPVHLSAAQAQLWYFTQLAPGNPVYNGAFVIRKRGPFEVNSFRAALNEIVRRHEILRSTFEMGDEAGAGHPSRGDPRTVARRPAAFPADQREREADSLADAEARRPYQVERGPLIRPRLVALGGLPSARPGDAPPGL